MTLATLHAPTASDITQAANRLAGLAVRTPLIYHARLSQLTGARIFLKREDLQLGGSYKIRGAYNLMASLNAVERAAGAVTASSGNHARAVAEVAARLKLPATVFVPEGTATAQLAAIRRAGGSFVAVRTAGQSLGEALAVAQAEAADTGATLVHPYNDPRIVAGQGSLAVEIIAQLAEIGQRADGVVAPIGGGGLITGLGLFLAANREQTAQLIGVQPAQATGMLQALAAPSRHPLAAHVLSQSVQVDENQVRDTMAELESSLGIAASPAGALAAAAIPQLAAQRQGQTIVAIITGAR